MCKFKNKQTWKECPKNKFGINKDKRLDDNGDLILCTLTEYEEGMEFNDDPIYNDFLDVEEDSKLTRKVIFYAPSYCKNLAVDNLVESEQYMFMQSIVEVRASNLMSKNKEKIDPN